MGVPETTEPTEVQHVPAVHHVHETGVAVELAEQVELTTYKPFTSSMLRLCMCILDPSFYNVVNSKLTDCFYQILS